MIDGLKPTIRGEELLPLINAQVEFHTKRAEFYAAERLGPREQLAGKAREHKNAAARLAFVGKYLDVSETYRLSENDLHTLGVMRH